MTGHRKSNLKGVSFILISSLSFALASLIVRSTRGTFRPDTLVFLRYMLQASFTLPLVLAFVNFREIKNPGERIKFIGLRSLFGMGATYCYYSSLQHIPMAMTGLISVTVALWASLTARVWLKERWTSLQALFALLVCGGIVLSFQGKADPSSVWTISIVGVLFALAGSISRGGGLAVVRRLRLEASPYEIVCLFGVFGALVALPFFLSDPQWPASTYERKIILSIGAFATVGQLFLTIGLRHTQTMLGAIGNLVSPIFNIILGAVFLSELPPPLFYLSVVIVVGGIYGLIVAKPASR